jgi:hypothetical protein
MRRADPERIYQAKLAGLRARIVGHWQTKAAADALLAEWDREATMRGLDRADSAYWDDGAAWIENADSTLIAFYRLSNRDASRSYQERSFTFAQPAREPSRYGAVRYLRTIPSSRPSAI